MTTREGTDLAHFSIDDSTLEKTLGAILGHDVDDADVYLEHTVSDSVSLEEGIVKKAGRTVRQGAGVRAISGERTGYAHTDEIDDLRLLEAAHAARAIARSGSDHPGVPIVSTPSGSSLYATSDVDPSLEEKLTLLQAIDARARAYDPRVEQVMASVTMSQKTVAIVKGDGQILLDQRPLIRLNVSCIVEENGNRQVGGAGGGGRKSTSHPNAVRKSQTQTPMPRASSSR